MTGTRTCTHIGPRSLKDFLMPLPRSIHARPFVLGAPVGPRPLEDLKVHVLGSVRARLLVPVAPPGTRPIEDLNVPVMAAYDSGPAPTVGHRGGRSLQPTRASARSRDIR